MMTTGRLFAVLVVFSVISLSRAADPKAGANPNIHQRNGYTLIVEDKQSGVSKEFIQHIVDLFFRIYPRIVQDYKRTDAPKEVRFFFEPNEFYVNVTVGGKLSSFGGAFVTDMPLADTLVCGAMFGAIQGEVTRETDWIASSVNNYACDKYTETNGRFLPAYKKGQEYKYGMQIGGAFLKFVEARYPGIVMKLDQARRTKTYNERRTWRQLTGKTVQQLWQEYAKAGAKGGAKRMKKSG